MNNRVTSPSNVINRKFACAGHLTHLRELNHTHPMDHLPPILSPERGGLPILTDQAINIVHAENNLVTFYNLDR